MKFQSYATQRLSGVQLLKSTWKLKSFLSRMSALLIFFLFLNLYFYIGSLSTLFVTFKYYMKVKT